MRVEEAEYADAMGVAAVATSTGVRATGRESGCYLVVSTLATEGDETQTGFAFSVGRTPGELDIEKASREGAERATRLLGATKPASKRLTVVFDPYVTAQFLSVLSAALNGESVLKGRSLFANRVGEEVASPLFTLVDDPTNPLAYSATPVDGEGLATRRTSLIEGGVLQGFLQSSYSGRRSGTASTGNAVRGFKSTPSCGAIALQLAPGTRSQAELVAGIDDGVLIQQVAGIHSGREPRLGRLLDRCLRPGDRRRHARRPRARVHHRVDHPEDAEGRRRGRGRRRLAADARRRRQPRDPRRDDERLLTPLGVAHRALTRPVTPKAGLTPANDSVPNR